MSKEAIKFEIIKVLDQFSDQALEELLSFLKDLDSKDAKNSKNNQTLTKILLEDKELLIKLAQ